MRCSLALLAVVLAPLTAVADDPPAARPKPTEGWRSFGRVTDLEGNPVAGAEIWASCGMGTLHRTGSARSGEDGRYELTFGPGMFYPNGRGAQAATISAHKPGFFEANLNRQGGCTAADAMPDEETLKSWGATKDRVFLPGKPLELNFVMRPAGRVGGRLVDEQDRPLAGYSVSLTGAELPPSSSVLAYVKADAQGRFAIEDIPTTYRFQLEVRKAESQPPWDDTWASAALRFERPGKGNLLAFLGDREIRLDELVIRVAGPGMHGRTAVPLAGNAGVLDLTAEPAAVTEKGEKLLAARSAVLTLRNASRPDVSRSLVPEAVPAAARPSSFRLARTRPNAAGETIISFENPGGGGVEPGKNQVIFQVFVGVSGKPIRERIFRQLEVRREGRYEVPVKIPPDAIDDSRVAIVFVTIQPDHDAWVKAFFDEGKGTAYKGMWQSDGGLLPVIPLAPSADR